MAHKKMQKSTSLCEKSMDLVVNIIKLSSLSVLALNLSEKNDTNRPFVVSTPDDPSQFSKSKRSQAQASMSKMQTYLMEQDAGVTRHSSIYEGHIDDGTFSEYINRFHERNQNEVNTEATNGKVSARFHDKNSFDKTLAAPAGFPVASPPPPPPSQEVKRFAKQH